ncbi:MAG: hypothetical protein JNK02_01010 [Planctomycetes bacterium]|nr:hypothetical protein [Planctomycetota bacterium]
MTREDPWQQIRAAGQQIAERLQQTTIRIDHLLLKAGRFGERGWPLNPDWDSAELANLVDALDEAGEAETDDVFVAFYEADDGARILQVIDDLSTCDHMRKWHVLMRQSQQAIDRDHNVIVVPALLTVLEGMVFTRPTTCTGVKQEIEQISQNQKDDFGRLVWQTITDYVNMLFARSNFQTGEPHFNRHWIMHGRATADWTRTDVIRLLHGIHTIHSALSGPA